MHMRFIPTGGVVWSVGLSVCWSRPYALPKRLNRSRCRLEFAVLGPKNRALDVQITHGHSLTAHTATCPTVGILKVTHKAAARGDVTCSLLLTWPLVNCRHKSYKVAFAALNNWLYSNTDTVSQSCCIFHPRLENLHFLQILPTGYFFAP